MAEPVERQILRRTNPSNEEIVINFGPQHPSTHGVIDFVTQTNGEIIRRSIPDIGYLHRGLEKIGEMVDRIRALVQVLQKMRETPTEDYADGSSILKVGKSG